MRHTVMSVCVAFALAGCATETKVADGRDGCLRETGTRIDSPDRTCPGEPGGVITRDGIDRSGAQTVGDTFR
jgi:hypothetical protein